MKVFYRKDVRQLKVPLWPELGLKKMLGYALEVLGFIDYLPPNLIRRPAIRERSYFWGVMSTLKPDVVAGIIADCHKQRVALRTRKAEEPKPIYIHHDFVDVLLQPSMVPFKFYIILY